MPELNLPDLHLPEAGLYLLAVMFFPSAPAEHTRFVRAAMDKVLLGSFAKLSPSDLRRPPILAAIPEFARAALAPRVEEFAARAHPTTQAGCVRGDIAAKMFLFVLACAEHEPQHASIEYAYGRFYALHNNRVAGVSRATLIKHWTDYRPVAHLWAAWALKRHWFETATSAALAYFLGYAESLRRMGETIRPAHSQQPLLPPEITWKVPERFTLPACDPLPMPSPAVIEEIVKGSLASDVSNGV